MKAVKILKSQPLGEFEKDINLSEVSDIITQVTLTVRTNYPIVKDASVIRVLETFNTQNIKQYKIFFYVPGSAEEYKVYGFTVEYNSQASEPVYKVLTVKLYVDSGKLVDKVLEEAG